MLDALNAADVAREVRKLARQPDSLVIAGAKIVKLRRALFLANDHGESSCVRASGDCVCPICGDEYRHHGSVPDEPYLTAICTGMRAKL